MNERIKQLAEQCESFGSWDNKTYSFDKEKFAELIVKECLSYMEEGDIDYTKWMIKQHFEIKE